MRLVVVDGGKSELRVRLDAGDRHVEGRGPGFAHGASPDDDRAALVRAIRLALADARGRSGEAGEPGGPAADVAFVGLTGLLGDVDQLAMLEAELAVHLAHRVFVVDDGLLAHAGALGGPGVVAAVGTGVNVTSLAADGTSRMRDAWGPTFGDRGSAYAIGLAGIRAVVASFDDAGPPTALTGRLDELVGGPARSLATVERFIRAPKITARIAAFAQPVLELSSRGDPVARAIESAEAAQLAATIVAAALPGHPITWTGRLLHAQSGYLAAVMAACPPEVAERFQSPRGTGLDAGAALVRAVDDPADLYAAALRRRAMT